MSSTRPALSSNTPATATENRWTPGTAAFCLPSAELVACRRDLEPDATQALAGGVAGLAVADERVEQMAVVGDLHRAVRLRLHGDLRRLDTGAGGRRARGGDRGPVGLDAGRNGARGAGAVGFVQIHGHAL